MSRREMVIGFVCVSITAAFVLLGATSTTAQCGNGNYSGNWFYSRYYNPGYYSNYYAPSPSYAYSGGNYQSFSAEPTAPSTGSSTRENPSGAPSTTFYYAPQPAYYYGGGGYYGRGYGGSWGGTAEHPSPY
jgi:hypothetical protein